MQRFGTGASMSTRYHPPLPILKQRNTYTTDTGNNLILLTSLDSLSHSTPTHQPNVLLNNLGSLSPNPNYDLAFNDSAQPNLNLNLKLARDVCGVIIIFKPYLYYWLLYLLYHLLLLLLHCDCGHGHGSILFTHTTKQPQK